MKRFLLTLLTAAICQLSLMAAKPEAAKLQKVTVYLQGAHLYYAEQVNLQAGNNEISFENISPYINVSTLQASVRGGTLMEAYHTVRYRERKVVPKLYDQAIKHVLDSLEELGYDLQDIDNHLSVLAQEKKMLLNNRLIRGDSPKDSLPLLKESLAFTREKLNDILSLELKWNRKKNNVNKEMARLQDRHHHLLLLQEGSLDPDGFQATPIQQIIISVYAEQAGLANVNFNYFIQQAGWAPNYDMVANSSTNQIQLKYFANVNQASGILWKDAALTLSTSNPMERNIKPSLATWFIGYQEYRKMKRLEVTSSNRMMKLEAKSLSTKQPAMQESDSYAGSVDDEKLLTDYIEISENMLRTEYEIKLKYEIASDGKAHKVLIKQQDIGMDLAFAAVPKICQDAFLMGRVTGWEELNIIPGNARIYFDGAYVGETYLNNQSTNDTLELNLGKDKSMVITRKKVKEKTKVKSLENEKVETRSIEIVVRNTKNIPVVMNLEDQIPVVAGNAPDIKVTLLDADGANLDESTGLLKWNMKLGSKESKKIVFTYEIRYPKNKPVYGL